MEEQEKRPLRWILALLTLTMLLVLYQGWKIHQLSDQVSALSSTLQQRTSALAIAIDGSEGRLTSEIRSLEEPISDHHLTLAGVDPEDHSLLFTVSLTLKEERADTLIDLTLLTQEGEPQQVPLAAAGGGIYESIEPIHLPLDTEDIHFSAVVTADGASRAQELEDSSLELLLPIRCSSSSYTSPAYYSGYSGTFTLLNPIVYLDDPDSNLSTGIEPCFHVLRNGEEVFAAGGIINPDIFIHRSSNYIPVTWPDSFEAAPGDTFRFTFTCRDENGLGYEFDLIRVRIDEAGKVKEILRPEAYVPRLFW